MKMSVCYEDGEIWTVDCSEHAIAPCGQIPMLTAITPGGPVMVPLIRVKWIAPLEARRYIGLEEE